MNTPEIIQSTANPLVPDTREVEAFIATLGGEFALKVANDQDDRYEDVARIATGALVPDRFCYFDNDTSMKNFAEDAEKGAPMMQSHNTYWDIGIGYTFASEHLTSKKEVNVGFYILRDMGLNGQYSYDNTNSYILALEKKAIREVSMGISGGRSVCSICGGNIWMYRECPHYPGREYEVGANKTKKLCTYTIYDGHLDEVSFVANGAVPGAIVLKSQEMCYNKEISIDDVAQVFRERYPRIDTEKSIFHNKVYAFGKAFTNEPTQENHEMANPVDLTPTIQGLQAAHPNLSIPDDPVEAFTHLTTNLAAAQSNADQFKAQNTQLQTQLTQSQQDNAKLQLAANDGQTYRQEWYDAAKEAHIARFGSELPEVYVSLFDNPGTPASEIRKYAVQWAGEINQDENGNPIHTGQARTQEQGNQGQQNQHSAIGARILLPKVSRIGRNSN